MLLRPHLLRTTNTSAFVDRRRLLVRQPTLVAVLRHDNMLTDPTAANMLPKATTGRGAAAQIVYSGDEAAAEIRALIHAVVSPTKHACRNRNGN